MVLLDNLENSELDFKWTRIIFPIFTVTHFIRFYIQIIHTTFRFLSMLSPLSWMGGPHYVKRKFRCIHRCVFLEASPSVISDKGSKSVYNYFFTWKIGFGWGAAAVFRDVSLFLPQSCAVGDGPAAHVSDCHLSKYLLPFQSLKQLDCILNYIELQRVKKCQWKTDSQNKSHLIIGFNNSWVAVNSLDCSKSRETQREAKSLSEHKSSVAILFWSVASHW